MIKQRYNHLDRSIQKISGFFETRVKNLETPSPTPGKNSKKQKASSYDDFVEDSSEEEKPSSRKKFCQYYGKYSHSMDGFTTLKGRIKKAKSNKSKGYKKGGEKMYSKYEVDIFIENN